MTAIRANLCTTETLTESTSFAQTTALNLCTNGALFRFHINITALSYLLNIGTASSMPFLSVFTENRSIPDLSIFRRTTALNPR